MILGECIVRFLKLTSFEHDALLRKRQLSKLEKATHLMTSGCRVDVLE